MEINILQISPSKNIEFVRVPSGKMQIGISKPEIPLSSQANASVFLLVVLFVAASIALWKVFVLRSREKIQLKFCLKTACIVFILLSAIVVSGGNYYRTIVEWNHYSCMHRNWESLDGDENFYFMPTKYREFEKGFYLSRYEITQPQFAAVMGYNRSKSKGPNLPVTNINELEAQEFCKRLSKIIGKKFRLPYDDEWEYACRAGSSSLYCNGNTVSDLERVGWYIGNDVGSVQSVGQKNSNKYGLYDMHGNVMELCLNQSKKGDYPSFFYRGGAFQLNALSCSSYWRDYSIFKGYLVGFRVLMED